MQQPPQGGGFPPQGGGYPPQGGGYPPQGGGYPPQGGGYPQGPPQGFTNTPAPSGGTNWLKILGIGCGVIVLIGLLCGFGMFMCWQGVTASKDHAHAFLGELRTGNTTSAYARMDPTYQATHDQPTFERSVAAMPALSSNTDATFNNFNVTNGVHALQGTLTTPNGPVDIRMTLREAPGGFYVTSLIVGGSPLM
ncbi:MAG: hypothetical protein H6721_05075 [Sandaracinus sp.]|nr:hypothetical protein [Sandaracinus sp.]MCB9631501.1 hypothetical protein [Sandaracinus sp.]